MSGMRLAATVARFAPASLRAPLPLQKPDPSVARCGLPRGSPRTRILYSTGVKATCRCGPDPFLKNPAWRMCHCPPPDPIPTLKTYSAWPAPKEASPSLKYWLRCEGR